MTECWLHWTPQLKPGASFDCRLLQTAIKNERFRFEEMDAFHNNPMTYADVIEVNIYIKRNFAPLEERVDRSFPSKPAPKVMARPAPILENPCPTLMSKPRFRTPEARRFFGQRRSSKR